MERAMPLECPKICHILFKTLTPTLASCRTHFRITMERMSHLNECFTRNDAFWTVPSWPFQVHLFLYFHPTVRTAASRSFSASMTETTASRWTPTTVELRWFSWRRRSKKKSMSKFQTSSCTRNSVSGCSTKGAFISPNGAWRVYYTANRSACLRKTYSNEL